jgi:hypothetical protein
LELWEGPRARALSGKHDLEAAERYLWQGHGQFAASRGLGNIVLERGVLQGCRTYGALGGGCGGLTAVGLWASRARDLVGGYFGRDAEHWLA